MSNYDDTETGSETSVSVGEIELLPEIQGAITKALREFEAIYDLSGQPELLLTLYSCVEKSLKTLGKDLPALTDPNYILGQAPSRQQRKKPKASAYQEFTREAWDKYREEKKINSTKQSNGVFTKTPQDLCSEFAGKMEIVVE